MAALFPLSRNVHSDGMVASKFGKENTEFMSVCAPLWVCRPALKTQPNIVKLSS